ncbi:MAG: PucR family transcriptional regulator [Mycobacteriales bacterium]
MRDPGPDEVLRTFAARLLAERLEALTGELVAAIRARIPEYHSETLVAESDLLSSCRDNLTRALEELAGSVPVTDGPPAAQSETGRRRAQQGVPLESLLFAYRLGGRVLWEGLVGEVRRTGSRAEQDRMLTEATSVWEVIDHHSFVVATAYRAEELRLAHRGLQRRHALFDAVLEGEGVDPEVARTAAAVLGLPIAGPRFVVAAAYEGASDPLRAPEDALSARGYASAWMVRARREVGVIVLSGVGEEAGAVEVLRGCTIGRVAVSPVVDGFAQLGVAYRLADVALATLPPGCVGLVRLADRLPQALLAASPDLARILVEEILGRMAALPAPERDVLLDTLAAVLDADGSPAQAASRLYVHRNTVLKRMRRLQSLTGRTLARSGDRLELHLALLAWRSSQESDPTAASSGQPSGAAPTNSRDR